MMHIIKALSLVPVVNGSGCCHKAHHVPLLVVSLLRHGLGRVPEQMNWQVCVPLNCPTFH
jgi:hypothetical protein